MTAKAELTRIDTRGTTPHELEKLKESATTRPTIRKILEDRDIFLKA
jgi:hypothetical protein